MLARGLRHQLEMGAERGLPAMKLRAHRRTFPGDRFRADTKMAHNSRFVSRFRAAALASQYQGVVIEMFTRAEWYAFKSRDLDACPTCKAAKGEICKTKKLVDRSPHRTRVAVA